MSNTRAVIALCITSLAAAPASAGEIHALGAGTDDFQLGPTILADPNIGAIIERDRMYMAARPGFQSKRIPFSLDDQGRVFAGGAYLFDTFDDAKEFSRWLRDDFILDGIPILQREYFLDVKAYPWKVVGAYEFGDVKTEQLVFRVERWEIGQVEGLDGFLDGRYHAIRETARRRGYTAVWLLVNKDAGLVSVVSFDDRDGPWDPAGGPDTASIDALASAPSMGRVFDQRGWHKAFDRTSWVLTAWFPFRARDSGDAATWPNSPPFPQPTVGDGLCVPSRGETYLTAPADCPPTCGDGVPDPGETDASCPSDVRTYP